MAKRPVLSARARRIVKKLLAMPEPRIDYSDIPPISREQLSRMKRLGKRALKPGATKIVVITTS
jgi:hypothetical protein